MELNENSEIVKIEKEFLANKNRKACYDVKAYNESFCDEDCFVQEFDEDELTALKSLREKYGKDDFCKHLEEVFTDEDRLHDLSYGEEIFDIDLDQPSYQYRFSRYDLVNGTLQRTEMKLVLNDNCYLSLLKLCIEDKGRNMNKLRCADKSMYEVIMHYIYWALCDDDRFFSWDWPFLIVMDEIMEDADKIAEEHPEFRSIGYVGYNFF